MIAICSICTNMFVEGFKCGCDKTKEYCYICFGNHVKDKHNQSIPNSGMIKSIQGEVIGGKSFSV